jgi:hypothetical protein
LEAIALRSGLPLRRKIRENPEEGESSQNVNRYLLTVYDKSERENLTNSELRELLKYVL